MPGQEIVGERVGEDRTEDAQDQSAEKKRDGIGHDLFIDCRETQIVPVEGRAVRSAEQECADPVGGAKDRDDGPGVVDEGADHKGEEVQA